MYSERCFLFLIFLQVCCCQNLQLEQVLILSRHNVRTPLSKNLFEFTPKPWPSWKEKNGYLTPKGALLEGYMGEYFYSWLIKEGLLNKACPNQKLFYVYSNNAQRTIASAEAFISKGFPGCNITIHHAADTQKDPIFNPTIHNSTKQFKTEALEQMKLVLQSLHFNSSYKDLEGILNYNKSSYCLLKHKCDFINDKNKLFVNTGFKPNLEGPLKISKSVIDSFIMENYEGFPMNEVAWGMLSNVDEWNAILGLTRGYHNVIFNTTLVAQDVARPLLKFMYDLLVKQQHEVILLMGHDANIYTVLKSLEFKPYTLKEQYEKIPVGGKLVFQKWMDIDSRKFYLKVCYVYQGTEQMRDGRKLSFINPPTFTSLELSSCKKHGNGFYLWDDFLKLLNDVIGEKV